MNQKEKTDLAIAAGHSWAERKADSLRDVLAAIDWPDLWTDADDGALPFASSELSEDERRSLRHSASHAAHEKWRQLVTEQRALESTQEEEQADEARALHLESALRDALPQGMTVGRDGARVYVQDSSTGMERTVSSLESAWRAISDWKDKRTPGI